MNEPEEPTLTRALLTPGPLFVPGADELTNVHKTISKFDYHPTVTEQEERERWDQQTFNRFEEKVSVNDELLLSDSLIYPEVRPIRAHRYSNDDLDHDLEIYPKPNNNPFAPFKYSSRQRGSAALVSSSVESWNSSEFNILAETPEVDLHRLEKAANLAEYYGAIEGVSIKNSILGNAQLQSSGLFAFKSKGSLLHDGAVHQARPASERKQLGAGSSIGVPTVHAQNFELRLSHPSFASTAPRTRSDPPLSSSYDHLPGSSNNKMLRRAQLSDSPVRNSMRTSRDRRSDAQSSGGSFDRSEPLRKGGHSSSTESTATKIAFKEFMQQYEVRLKIDPLTAQRFAEETIELMHGSTRWRAYLELAENAKKNSDFTLVRLRFDVYMQWILVIMVVRRVRCFGVVPPCSLSRGSRGWSGPRWRRRMAISMPLCECCAKASPTAASMRG